MDEKIIENRVGLAICRGSRCGPDSQFPCGYDCEGTFEGGDGCLAVARAAISAYEAALSDAGYIIVPEKPTEQMIRAAFDPYGRNIYADGEAAWREMLDAMPNTTDRSELAPPSE